MRRALPSVLGTGLLMLGVALLGAATLQGPGTARAANHDVTVTSGGFSPASITIAPGDTVTWTNNSGVIQTIHSLLPGSDPNFFSKAFLYQNESWSHTFNNAGTFAYHSNTTEITGTVIVSAGGGGGAPTPTHTSTPSGGGGGGGGSVSVTITSGGFSPQSISVPSGTTVTWTNNSGATQTIHSLLPGSDPNFFAKPFLYNGESWSHTFTAAGTYQYHSNTSEFTGTVVVTGGSGGGATPTNAPSATKTPTAALPPGTTPTKTPTPPPGATSTPTGPKPTATKTPTRTPTKGPTATPTAASNAVSITESGYQPQILTVSVGTTVTWTNNAARPRSATSTKSGPGAFYSGLIQPGKTFSHAFTIVGTFEYKSAITGFTGTVVVVPAGSSGGGPGGGGSLPFSPMGPGWNLVTYGGATGAPSQALAQLGGNYTAVYYWDGQKWHRYFRPGVAPSFLNSITTVAAGQPLWILATAAIP